MTENEARIEAAAGRAWPPARAGALHGWRLRAGPTATRRENSVETLAFTGAVPLEAAIAAAVAWYAAAGKPACFQLNPASRPLGLDAALAASGYRLVAPSDVMLRPLDRLPPEPAAVTLEGRATPWVMAALADPRWPMAERAARAALFARIRKPLAFAVRVAGGAPVAGGLCVVDGPLAGIAAMRTTPPARRPGHGRAVLDRLLAWAGRMGATTAWLQVEADNASALGLYRSAGFARAYGYHYRVAASG